MLPCSRRQRGLPTSSADEIVFPLNHGHPKNPNAKDCCVRYADGLASGQEFGELQHRGEEVAGGGAFDVQAAEAEGVE